MTDKQSDSHERTVTVFYDQRMLAHQPDAQSSFEPGRLDKRVRQILKNLDFKWNYPEDPERLKAIKAVLDKYPIPQARFEKGAIATFKQLSRVHAASYLENIFELEGKNAWLDVDTTAVSQGSIKAAKVAAGTAVAAVDAVMKGQTRSAFAVVRPPGHHAESVRARGFCFFNNVAVAAAHAQAQYDCQRVLIIDWDAHHGNGTQEIFWADPDVMFFDIHREAPFYPGSGKLEDVGAGLGEGTTVNVPLPGGCGDTTYLTAFREILVPAADWFKPDLVLVSAGYDTHLLDMAMNVTYHGFAAMTGIVQDIAERHCNGRIAFCLEGGYNPDSLSKGVRATLNILAGGTRPRPGICGIAEVRKAAAFHHDAFAQSDQ